ncbi:hypothetical protein [Nakamurella lactea]|jgi:hypothetical protein|uniref:hypothetical protein n=1 Tax=Nakamurella lactea TaxID=459515 RepID=UPI00048FEEB7|nr:hypothetical protein [Nakamurella lactea]
MNEAMPTVFARFEEFPLTARPRPVILLEDPARIGDRGFVDADAKNAWLDGAIEPAVPLAAGILDLLTGGRRPDGDITPLTITASSPVTQSFRCDRGGRRLPAYRLTITGMPQPVIVIDPTVDIWWPPTGALATTVQDSGWAYIADHGRTLQIPASGGFLTRFHGAEFDEHETYVVGRAITSRRTTTATAIPLSRIGTRVTGRLQNPLGDRVLLRSDGHPLGVRRM